MSQVEQADTDETREHTGPADDITEDKRSMLKNTELETLNTEDDKQGINKSSLGSFGGNNFQPMRVSAEGSFFKVNRSAKATLTMGSPDEDANTITINGTTF